MTSYFILYFYVVITTALCCVNKGNVIYAIKPLISIILLIVLIFFAGLRGHQVDPDSANYIDWFNDVLAKREAFSLETKDPAFYIISYLFVSFGLGVTYLFLCYATIALWSKFQLIKHSPYVKNSHIFLYLYFCRFYFVHDMTQIRTGVAVGLASLALILLNRKKFVLSFLILISAISFHLSSVLILPFFILMLFGYDFKSRVLPFFALILALLINLYSDYLFDALGLNEITRIGVYLSGEYAVHKINLISVYLLAKIFVASWLFLYRWHALDYFDRLVIYLVMTGVALQLTLINNDALALRSAEVFSIFDLILLIIPIYHLFKNTRIFYILYLFLLGSIFFISSLKIMMPYESILN